MSRKTMNVEQLRQKVNAMLADSTCNKDIRQGSINVLELVLHATSNYHGFRYLHPAEVPSGCLPGINNVQNIDTLDHDTRYEKNFENTDRTRCHYY